MRSFSIAVAVAACEWRATAFGAEVYFLMSTWNPYQVVVMRTHLTTTTPPARRGDLVHGARTIRRSSLAGH